MVFLTICCKFAVVAEKILIELRIASQLTNSYIRSQKIV